MSAPLLELITATRLANLRNRANSIAFGNDKFIYVGANGRMAYSTDGINWTAVDDNTFGTTNIYSIAYVGGMFIAGGFNGKIAYSTGN